MMEDFERDDILSLIQRPEIEIPPGTSIVGDHLQRVRSLFAQVLPEYADMLVVVEPGDLARLQGLSLTAPIAYDVWYLHHTENIFPMDRYDAELVMLRMEDFFENLHGMKPLRVLRDPSDLGDGFSEYEMRSYFVNTAPWYIHEIRFETLTEGGSFWYQSPGGKPEDHAGYLGIPVGQLGVMEVVSVVRETEELEFDTAMEPVEGKDMFPPIFTEKNACVGTHLVESGYDLQDETEYPAETSGPDLESAHQWMRRWIPKDATWPVPGEFVGVLCRPFPLHVWWFQDTCPFVYAGNWIETEYLTSGVIEEIQEPEGEEVGPLYSVFVKDEYFHIKATDFYGYEVGDRVAIIKMWGEPIGIFDWRDLERKGDWETVTDWFIAPLSFYEE
jgi:hypothetical protein